MAQGESLAAFLVFDSIANLKPASSGGLWMIRASPPGVWAWKQTASGWTSLPSSRSCSATCAETNVRQGFWNGDGTFARDQVRAVAQRVEVVTCPTGDAGRA